MQAKDVPPGMMFYISERMGDHQSTAIEVRETYYLRDPDGPCRFPHNVRAARLATVQGEPKAFEPPRYRAVLAEPCRDPGEIDGRVIVHVIGEGASGVWGAALGERFNSNGQR